MTAPRIQLTVVVSGDPVDVTVNTNNSVEKLIREALHEAGNVGGDLAGWILKDSNGNKIPKAQKIKDSGIEAGATLYLTTGAGGGG